ncbi:hypothetical protein BDV25DRAFT_135088 [Aspergillus avenaceus]|uniref:DUF7770 domain-containing protein n=1 Tax=Aspergillus avenaceus TaxID=36643 RepID=A0A5N6UA44_ASPAV|nr:hypothetical protein BDV25DRAFT_135088 [Aspergillus avenaceus]
MNQTTFDPIKFIPPRDKETILNLPVLSVNAVGHEKLPLGGNHWCFYLAISDTESVSLDMIPTHTIPDTVNPKGSKGNLVVSRLDTLTPVSATKIVQLAVQSGLKVQDFVAAIEKEKRHQYEFNEIGQGCRTWVNDQMDLFIDSGLVIHAMQVVEAKRAVAKQYPEAIMFPVCVVFKTTRERSARYHPLPHGLDSNRALEVLHNHRLLSQHIWPSSRSRILDSNPTRTTVFVELSGLSLQATFTSTEDGVFVQEEDKLTVGIMVQWRLKPDPNHSSSTQPVQSQVVLEEVLSLSCFRPLGRFLKFVDNFNIKTKALIGLLERVANGDISMEDAPSAHSMCLVSGKEKSE